MTYQSIYDRLACVRSINDIINLLDINDIRNVNIKLPVSIENAPISREDAAMGVLNLYNSLRGTNYFDYVNNIAEKLDEEAFIRKQDNMKLLFPYGGDNIKNGICPLCEASVNFIDFTDDIDYKEYMISGACKHCQDAMFPKSM